MQTLDKKFEEALAQKEDALQRLRSERLEIQEMRKSIKKFPLIWPYDVTSKNAKRVAIQTRILYALFVRHDELQELKRPRSQGLTTHQIWKRLYPSHPGTSSATFRGHLSDLKKKGLITNCEESGDWMPLAKALAKRVGAGK